MSTDFQLSRFPFQASEHRSKNANYNWSHIHLHVLQRSQFSSKVQVLVFLFDYLYSTPLRVFHISFSWWASTWVSDSKSPQVSRTILSILADFDNAVVWMVSTYPIISKHFSPCTNRFVTLPSTPISNGHGDTSSNPRRDWLHFT